MTAFFNANELKNLIATEDEIALVIAKGKHYIRSYETHTIDFYIYKSEIFIVSIKPT